MRTTKHSMAVANTVDHVEDMMVKIYDLIYPTVILKGDTMTYTEWMNATDSDTFDNVGHLLAVVVMYLNDLIVMDHGECDVREIETLIWDTPCVDITMTIIKDLIERKDRQFGVGTYKYDKFCVLKINY